jgi:glutamyl-tRNA synthetase
MAFQLDSPKGYPSNIGSASENRRMSLVRPESRPYRGRIAPSPSGRLHLGHAATFLTAAARATNAGGTLIYRDDDLDRDRCKPELVQAALDDLRWLGIEWTEGPDCGGPNAPYAQSARIAFYNEAFEGLRQRGLIYPCSCTRSEVARALSAPHPLDEEPIYPGTCRPAAPTTFKTPRSGLNWRFRIPERETLTFNDLAQGMQSAVSQEDFGDFLIWRKDDFPSYQLASAVDDALMGITEIVRGRDLITSTFRQLLIWRALEHPEPAFYHCPLLTDASGKRLAKRDDALSIHSLRSMGRTSSELISEIDARLLNQHSPE